MCICVSWNSWSLTKFCLCICLRSFTKGLSAWVCVCVCVCEVQLLKFYLAQLLLHTHSHINMYYIHWSIKITHESFHFLPVHEYPPPSLPSLSSSATALWATGWFSSLASHVCIFSSFVPFFSQSTACLELNNRMRWLKTSYRQFEPNFSHIHTCTLYVHKYTCIYTDTSHTHAYVVVVVFFFCAVLWGSDADVASSSLRVTFLFR